MRVARTLVGILLVAASALAFVAAGVLWALAGHEGPDGGFDATASGLDTPGYALVVPDVDALLRSRAPFVRGGGTALRIDAVTPTGPAFVGLAPLAAVQTYLGPVPYGRVDAIHVGLGGLPVTVAEVAAPPAGSAPAGARPAGIPGGAPAGQGFWAATGVGGVLSWQPGDRRYAGLALVVMRADAGASVQVEAHVTIRPGWLGSATVELAVAGLALAMVAVALLLWPARRREIVYVVEPAQLPEIAHRLGLPTPPATRTAGPPVTDADPVTTIQATAPATPDESSDATGRHGGDDGVTSGTGPDVVIGGPDAGVPADEAGGAWPAPAPQPGIPAIFADPRTRPTSLRTAMLLHPPVPAHRAAPPVTPAFEWVEHPTPEG